MKTPKAFLFDLDGVLLNTEPLNRLAWRETSKFFGSDASNEQLNKLLGRRKIECAHELINWNKRNINIEELINAHKTIQRKFLKEVKEIPGAQRIVKFCINKNIPIALVTSSTSESVAYKSRNNKWLDQIKIRVYGDNPEIKKGKPYAEPYLLAAKMLNVDPKSCWAIEDSDVGVRSAISAGCQVWKLCDIDYAGMDNKRKNTNNPIIINQISCVAEEYEKLLR